MGLKRALRGSKKVTLKKQVHQVSLTCLGIEQLPIATDGRWLVQLGFQVCRPYAEGANGTTNADGGGIATWIDSSVFAWTLLNGSFFCSAN